MQIIIANEVQEDISNIYNYIAKDSIKYANITVNNIYYRIYELETSSYIGRYVPEDPSHKYRELLYKSYRIVYTICEELETVYIHFVIHGRRDFISFFNTYNS